MNVDHKQLIKSGQDKFLFEVNSTSFLMKLVILLLFIVIGSSLINSEHFLIKIQGFILNGLMFAHAIVLQHQALHYTGLKNKTFNRVAGFILGIPMLSSFSHYQYFHLKHHKLLGTKIKNEFFEYSRSNNFIKFLIRLFNINVYLKAFRSNYISLSNSKFDEKIRDKMNNKIRNEYLLILAVIVVLFVYSLFDISSFMITHWLLTLFFVAGPVHLLMELPEHFECEETNRNIFFNTRSINKPSRLAIWFTNGNNYHIEHHMFPTIPVEKLKYVNKLCAGKARYQNENYFDFYKEFLSKLNKGEHR